MPIANAQTELEANLEMEKIAEGIRKSNEVAKAFFWHLEKHKLQPFDALVVLSGAFKSIQKSLPTTDDQTEYELLFISMIQNQYQRPPKIQGN